LIIQNNQDLPSSHMELINIEAGRLSEVSLSQLQAHMHGASIITNMKNQRWKMNRVNRILTRMNGRVKMRERSEKSNRSEIDPG
jgi:hypothetical protein